MTTVNDTPPTPTLGKARRTDGLVGNGLVLAGVVLYLCEFVGILGTGVHPMPLLPGSPAHDLATTYAGQAGKAGFLVGWYSLVLPGRVLIVLAMRRALLASAADRLGGTWRSLLGWATGAMAIGVAVEIASSAVLAGTAAAAERADNEVVPALDRVAHYLQVGIACPSMLALVVVGLAMWRSGVFPRVLAGLVTGLAGTQLLAGALLSAPSTADLQDSVSALNLIAFVVLIWLGVVALRHRPRASRAVSG